MRNVVTLLIVFTFALTLIGSAYAHKAEVVGDYKIEVGWKDEPPIAGQKNAIEIIVTVATEYDKESQESEEHDEEHTEHDEMEHEDHLEPGKGVSGLSENLEATVILKDHKTTLMLAETSKDGVYHADYTPTEVGFLSVNLVGEIGHQEFGITFHPEKVKPISTLSPLGQIRSGIEPDAVLCKEGLELFMRSDDSVACVKPTTAQILISRGMEITHLEMKEHETSHDTQTKGMLYVFADGKIAIIDPYDGEIVKEITDGLENVSWADPILTPDGKHVLVNDRDNAQVIVIDAHEQEIIKKIDVGPRPVHSYNPNHGNEIWTHSDAEGAFYVIDTETLEVTDVVLAAKNATLGGHGKLLYHEDLGSKSAATNTNDNGIHMIDREQKTAYEFVETCESGGTHAKAYSAASGHMYIECSTDDTIVVVDPQTHTIVTRIDAPGALFNVLVTNIITAVDDDGVTVIDGSTDQVVTTISVEGGPDKIYFYENNGKIYGFTANTMAPTAAVIDFDTMQVVKTLPAGDIKRPEGTSFFHRGGDIGDKFFFTPADGDNLVSIIDAENLELHMQIPIEGPHGLIFVPLHH